jgi:hypothetical protein
MIEFTRWLQSKALPHGMRFTSVCACLIIAVAGGCNKSGPIKNRKLTKEELALKQRNEIPAEISGAVWRIRWYNRATNKRLLIVASADSARGEITDPNDPTLTLHDVTGTVYREGVKTATIRAPSVAADQTHKILHAVGGVRLTSVTDPPDTVITGDTMTWDTTKDKLVVLGNAHAVMQKPGQLADTTSGDRLVFDTKLKILRNE